MILLTNPASVGGLQAHVAYLSQYLRKLEVEVTVFGPAGSRLLDYGDYREIDWSLWNFPMPKSICDRMGESWWTNTRSWHHFVDLIQKENFDLCHIHPPYALPLSRQIMLNLDVPKVATFHSSFPNSVLQNILPVLQKTFSNLVDGAIFVSNSTYKSWQSVCDPKLTTRVIVNGVDREFRPSSRVLPENGKRVVFLARLSVGKGLMHLLAAAKTLVDEGRQVQVVVVGDGHEREKAAAYIKENSLQDHVKLAGVVTGRTKVSLLADGDVFCAPYSAMEGLPLAVLEALACGCPVVGYRSEPMQELFADCPDIDQVLVKLDDVTALTRSLAKVLGDKKLRLRLRHFGLEKVKRYSWSKIARKTLDFYQAVLN